MRRLFILIIVAVVALLGLSFALMNAEPVTLNYYLGSIQAPFSLVAVFAIAIGAVLGVIAVLGVVFRQKREIARLKKQIRLAEKEVANLRALPLKDTH